MLTPKIPSNFKELKNILLLSSANCISLFGTSIYNFAISLYVLKITGSGLSFATTLVLGILSTVIVNPFAGVLADRLDKKTLSISTDLINGILLVGLYLITMRYPLNLLMIYCCTFLLNVFTTVYGISIEAAKPNLVLEKNLVTMNSINKVIEASASILGPMGGGVVFAFINIRYFLLINGISFVFSAFLECFIDFKLNFKDYNIDKIKINFHKDMIEGIHYLKERKNLINLFGVFIALNFFIGLSINVPLPYIINNVLKLNVKSYGIIQATFAIGMILGAVFIKAVTEKYTYQKILKASSILLSLCMAAIGFSVILHYKIQIQPAYFVYFIFIMLFTGIAISFIDIPIFNILQQTIPDEFRGRVLSLGISLAKIVLPIALILSGLLINLTPSYVLPILGGILLCLFTMFWLKS